VREIKFRAWDKDSKEMRLDVTPGPFSKIYPNEIWTDCGFTGEHGYLEDAILMQYTGLLDKNGVEIYEGDIIKFDGHLHEDKFISSICFRGGMFQPELRSEPLYNFRFRTIIGNIYENPELLTP